MEFEPEDVVRVLRCCHVEHAECVDQWLAVNKSCPICCKDIIASPEPAVAKPCMDAVAPLGC